MCPCIHLTTQNLPDIENEPDEEIWLDGEIKCRSANTNATACDPEGLSIHPGVLSDVPRSVTTPFMLPRTVLVGILVFQMQHGE
jgi:hypothetical protein